MIGFSSSVAGSAEKQRVAGGDLSGEEEATAAGRLRAGALRVWRQQDRTAARIIIDLSCVSSLAVL